MQIAAHCTHNQIESWGTIFSTRGGNKETVGQNYHFILDYREMSTCDDSAYTKYKVFFIHTSQEKNILSDGSSFSGESSNSWCFSSGSNFSSIGIHGLKCGGIYV